MTVGPPPASAPDPVDAATQTTDRFARGMSRGFAEASEAFSSEVAATSGCGDLIQRSIAGVIKANGRFLEEIADAVRQVGDDVARQVRRPAGVSDIDYEHLADLVAARLRADPLAAATPIIITP